MIEGIFSLLYHMTILSWKIATFIFVFAYNLVKPLYDRNPDAFKKWTKITLGSGLAGFIALALLGGYLAGWK